MDASSPVPSEPTVPTNERGRAIEFVDLKAQQRRIRASIDRAIARVLDHGQYINGPEIAELEGQLAPFCGARHAIACASGTDALLIAMMAKGIGPGDAIICPAFTYPATAETVVLLGATPVFVDVDPDTFNLDPAQLPNAVAAARRLGLTPRAVIAVDLFGLPADYQAIQRFADRAGLWVLADAAQSFGAATPRGKVGTLGLISATSFFPAKGLGCYGDGGAIFTDDDHLAGLMRSIRAHGQGAHKYDIVRTGVNGRLDTIQAAILIEKLRIYPDEIETRQAVAAAYTRGLAGAARVPSVPDGLTSVWTQYTLRVPAARREAIRSQLHAQAIPTQVYYPSPMHRQSAYQHFPLAAERLPSADQLADEVLSLPMHAYLTHPDQARIIAATKAAIQHPA
jgi:dTDP-4-amino-4,6-dideoxygalactose transaminase